MEILKLNAVAYPNSPNVYDSLADAYLASGQKDLARDNAKKALEHLESDTIDPEARRKGIKESAEQKLRQLGERAPQSVNSGSIRLLTKQASPATFAETPS